MDEQHAIRLFRELVLLLREHDRGDQRVVSFPLDELVVQVLRVLRLIVLANLPVDQDRTHDGALVNDLVDDRRAAIFLGFGNHAVALVGKRATHLFVDVHVRDFFARARIELALQLLDRFRELVFLLLRIRLLFEHRLVVIDFQKLASTVDLFRALLRVLFIGSLTSVHRGLR
ncbi:MAG: hypothetical protein QM831_31495 [Kofleriaceae bacterium]